MFVNSINRIAKNLISFLFYNIEPKNAKKNIKK